MTKIIFILSLAAVCAGVVMAMGILMMALFPFQFAVPQETMHMVVRVCISLIVVGLFVGVVIIGASATRQ